MNLNFSDFQAVDNTNKRTGATWKRGQNFDFRFRKFLSKKGTEKEAMDSFFHISDAKFDELGLAERAGRQIVSPDGQSFIAIVDEENGTFWKKSTKSDGSAQAKGKKFKSSIIEDALNAEGVIDLNVVGKEQKLTLEVVAENVTIGTGEKAFTAYAILKVGKGAESEESEGEDEDEEGAEEEQANLNAGVQETATQEASAQTATSTEETEEDEF